MKFFKILYLFLLKIQNMLLVLAILKLILQKLLKFVIYQKMQNLSDFGVLTGLCCLG